MARFAEAKTGLALTKETKKAQEMPSPRGRYRVGCGGNDLKKSGKGAEKKGENS